MARQVLLRFATFLWWFSIRPRRQRSDCCSCSCTCCCCCRGSPLYSHKIVWHIRNFSSCPRLRSSVEVGLNGAHPLRTARNSRVPNPEDPIRETPAHNPNPKSPVSPVAVRWKSVKAICSSSREFVWAVFRRIRYQKPKRPRKLATTNAFNSQSVDGRLFFAPITIDAIWLPVFLIIRPHIRIWIPICSGHWQLIAGDNAASFSRFFGKLLTNYLWYDLW